MFWVAIAIIIVGVIIAQVIARHNKKIEELKRDELELKKQEFTANPEYHKKVALESQIENAQYWFDAYCANKKADEHLLAEAKKKQDKKKIARFERLMEIAEKKWTNIIKGNGS